MCHKAATFPEKRKFFVAEFYQWKEGGKVDREEGFAHGFGYKQCFFSE